jgi:hypothetical protein
MGNTKEEIFCETPQYVNMSLFDVGGLDCTELVNTGNLYPSIVDFSS